MQFARTSPESVGISSSAILDFLRRAREACVEMHGLMILRHGKVCFEGWWKPYAPQYKHSMFSFSKTLTATAIGFAEQEGILTLDERLVDIFPDLCPEAPSENLQKADIYSLLTMSCGHETEISREEDASPDWIAAFLRHEFKYAPGTMFQYNTPGTNMLAAILQRKTGQTVSEYLDTRLFLPLGIEGARCLKLADGVERGGSGFFLSTEDMARLAQFYLQKGVWEGRRLLRESWFDRASACQIATVNPVFSNHDSNWRCGYGFQMWRCIPEGVYRMDGAYGQFGVIFPDQDAVVAINSASVYPDDLLNILWDTLLPAMRDEPLPEDAQAAAACRRAQQSLALPQPWGVRCRAGESAFGGRTYRAQPGTPGLARLIGGMGLHPLPVAPLQTLTLAFSETEALLTAVEAGEKKTLRVGLCGEPLLTALDGRPYAAAGAWRGADVFEITARCPEFVSGSTLRFHFRKDGSALAVTPALPTEGEATFFLPLAEGPRA